MNTINNIIIFIFIIGYVFIALEYYIKVNKTATAILTAVLTWVFLFLHDGMIDISEQIKIERHIGDASQIIFFLLSAMTLVEIIDSHKGFQIITKYITTKSKKKLLWIVAISSFFLSAVLDNLTTTIVMISLLRKLLPDKKERLYYCATVVIAANAGGAWTPIGDVTTTMLWIKGQVTALKVIKALFLPSLTAMIVSIFLIGTKLKGKFKSIDLKKHKIEPGAKLVLILGIISFAFVPVFRYLTHLPPFMGMLLGLGIIWVVTDIKHHKYETRKHLRVPFALTKIDTSSVLFFLGILLAVNSLEMVGILKKLAIYLDVHINNLAAVATSLGFLSALIDNVPLVAATMGMYDMAIYPPDSSLWQMIAYAAGTGGSILIIGSAAGVALMGIEKIDFVWYLKKISLTAITGYLAGMAVYLLLNTI
ncbi:MAG: Na(+)/H(+) antiporter NhaD [Candidatus Anoxychlamydiales bacterium]|nr:Na(+)/H(+) antiporter NhaD [Candidatus Anoxychlamydiales bacterium]